MARIESNTMKEIKEAGDAGALDRLEQFTKGGDQDDSNVLAREAIKRRRSELQQETTNQQLVSQAGAYRDEINKYKAGIPGQTETAYSGAENQVRRNMASQLPSVKLWLKLLLFF